MPIGEGVVVSDMFSKDFCELGDIHPLQVGLGLPAALGFATSGSRPDGRNLYGNVIVGVWEVKGGEACPLAGWLEAFASASRVAGNLVNRGVPIADVIVPTSIYTGGQAQFCATIVLEPFFPVLVPVSGVIDLATPEGCILARAYLEKARRQAISLGGLAKKDAPAPPTSISLSRRLYHAKVLDDSVLARGLGMFGSLDAGLHHMISAFNLLYASEDARPHVVFPLAVRTPDKGGKATFALIFPNLANEGYRIGFPPEEVIKPSVFIEQLRAVVLCIGKAGVVHGDLYPSNIMWRRSRDEGEVLIKIIDWDAAHCLREGKFVEAAKNRLRERGHPHEDFGGHDLEYVERLKLVKGERWGAFVMDDGDDAVKAKQRMDTAFFEIVRN